MLCQMCLRADATVHVLDHAACHPPTQADYCQTCYDLKYVNPPARLPDFPRPRFTIKRLMILAAVFAVPNAVVVLVMRSSLIPGTPAQIRDWTLQAFLGANFYCGIMVASVLTFAWLQKVEWHKRTGGLVPMKMEEPRKPGPKGYQRVRAFWKGASRRERFFRISVLLWPALLMFAFSRPGWVFWSANSLVSLCVLMGVAMIGQLLLFLGAVASTRRR